MATLHPTSELVALAWIQAALPSAQVGLTLPEDNTTWGSSGFVQVRAVGGTPHVHIPQRQPVISVDCWGVIPGSPRPPWHRVAQLAEQIRAATEAAGAQRQVAIAGQYRNAHVQTVYALTEPRPIPSDAANYAHTQFDMALTWVEAAT